MNLWTCHHHRSTKARTVPAELAAPRTIHRQESKRQRRAKLRAINRRAQRAMKGTL